MPPACLLGRLPCCLSPSSLGLPAPQIDYREEQKKDSRDFFKSRTRLWLRRLLHGHGGAGGGPLTSGPPAAEAAAAAALAAALAESGGQGGSNEGEGSGSLFLDTFRSFHPARQCAFTCWSTATNAR